MNFTLDESYMCDIHIKQKYSVFKGRDPSSLTSDEVLRILKGEDIITIGGTQDHPEFTRFREQLGSEGYIRIERSWSNGDRVLKPFTLNGVVFDIADKFCCATAMKHHLNFARKYKSLSSVTVALQSPKLQAGVRLPGGTPIKDV